MFEFITPDGLFRTQIHTLRETLPGVLDGVADSIHDARIATRRIREVLPLLGDVKRREPIEDLGSRFKRLGRSLGRVRDVDGWSSCVSGAKKSASRCCESSSRSSSGSKQFA
jgi:CHAD domain-containing protein